MTRQRALTIIALVLTAIVCSTGGAVAGAKITGAQIQDGTVTTKDVRNGSLLAADLKPSVVKSFAKPGARGATGPQGAAGAPGLVRAYGRVSAAGTVTQGSAGVVVTRAQTGVYCISAPGVDASATVAVVSPDYQYGSTGTGPNNSQSFVEYVGESVACAENTLVVRTFVRQYTTSGGNLVGTTLTLNNEPFTFLIP